jgi:hypothetical protein
MLTNALHQSHDGRFRARLDTVRAEGRGIVRQVQGQLGCRRYHTEDTCIWQVHMLAPQRVLSSAA